jgi:hypothetical protein
MLRPIFHIEHRGERKTEIVAVRYEDPPDDFQTVSTASTSRIGPRGRSKYVRAWVCNTGLSAAHGCRVYLEHLWINDRLVESERSPLQWADLGVFELPRMERGDRRGHYIDICAADSVNGRFQMISQKAQKGYHSYSEAGTYKLELSVEASSFHIKGRMLLILRYEPDDWRELSVISTRTKHRFIPWKV